MIVLRSKSFSDESEKKEEDKKAKFNPYLAAAGIPAAALDWYLSSDDVKNKEDLYDREAANMNKLIAKKNKLDAKIDNMSAPKAETAERIAKMLAWEKGNAERRALEGDVQEYLKKHQELLDTMMTSKDPAKAKEAERLMEELNQKAGKSLVHDAYLPANIENLSKVHSKDSILKRFNSKIKTLETKSDNLARSIESSYNMANYWGKELKNAKLIRLGGTAAIAAAPVGLASYLYYRDKKKNKEAENK